MLEKGIQEQVKTFNTQHLTSPRRPEHSTKLHKHARQDLFTIVAYGKRGIINWGLVPVKGETLGTF